MPTEPATALISSDIVGLGLIAATLALGGSPALAQAYPSKPIRIIAPFPTGTGPDANTREIAAEGFTTKNRDWNAN